MDDPVLRVQSQLTAPRPHPARLALRPRRPDHVRIVAGDRPAERRDLDRAQDRAAAIADPVGFVDSAEPLVIAEIQRVPELLLAIKAAVDEDTRPGRHLLTG